MRFILRFFIQNMKQWRWRLLSNEPRQQLVQLTALEGVENDIHVLKCVGDPVKKGETKAVQEHFFRICRCRKCWFRIY